MAFSAKGQGVFPNDVVLEQYEANVLGKIHSDTIKLPEPQSIACALTRKLHVFRGGTKHTKDKDTTYVDGVIAEAREELIADKWGKFVVGIIGDKSKGKSKGKRVRSKPKLVKLVGRDDGC